MRLITEESLAYRNQQQGSASTHGKMSLNLAFGSLQDLLASIRGVSCDLKHGSVGVSTWVLPATTVVSKRLGVNCWRL